MHPEVAQLQAWLAKHEAELLADYQAMLRIPSIEAEPLPDAPFGQANRDALDLALGKAKEWGMATKDLEGFIGYAEVGSGERLVMALGHLDVVPVGPGWKHDPFAAEIDGGYVYARGAVDDKGPTMAAFYAVRAIRECLPNIPARIRIAFGCNEESGFKCIHRYTKTEEAPTFGVAPDSGWPLYHAEKGIANLKIRVESPGTAFRLLGLEGGQRANIVIDHALARVSVAPEARAEVEARLADAWDRNVAWSWEGDVLRVEAVGKAAHGSTPFMGDSAATRALRFLFEIAPAEEAEAYGEMLAMSHPGGAGIGVAGSDEPSGDLTANLGVARTDGAAIVLTVNLRYPVTWTAEGIGARCEAALAKLSLQAKLEDLSDSKPLYFPKEHVLVKTIVDVYAEETGERLEPGVMGGGTYARAIPNTVSIGTGWTGDGKAHETDERLKIDHLYKMSRIYAHILWRLATMPA